jgi:single-strand DNA-binding protein
MALLQLHSAGGATAETTEVSLMVNRVILVGNMTKDAEQIATTGKAMTKMRVATNAHWKDASTGENRESAEFHSIVCFGRLAEICASYCAKGRRVYIEGRLRTRDYEGSDGTRKYTTEIVADTVKLLQPRDEGASRDQAEEFAAAS